MNKAIKKKKKKENSSLVQQLCLTDFRSEQITVVILDTF